MNNNNKKFGLSQIQRPSQNYTIKEEEVSLEETTPQTPGLSSSLATPEGHHEKIICEFEHFLSLIIVWLRSKGIFMLFNKQPPINENTKMNFYSFQDIENIMKIRRQRQRKASKRNLKVGGYIKRKRCF